MPNLPHLKTKTQINANCRRCPLHQNSKRVCLRDRNTEDRKRLVLFIDHPDYFADHLNKPFAFDTGKILDWMFARMSIDPADVGYSYTLRCYPKKELPGAKAERAVLIQECASYRFATIKRTRPKAIVAMGKVSLEAFTGKAQIGDFEGRRIPAWEPVVRDFVDGIWISHGTSYILTSPSDTPRVFRVLYKAAEEAGLNPQLNPEIPPFQWRNIR